MGARENESQISQNYIFHMKFSEFFPSVLSQFLWNLTFIFSDFHEKFSLVLLQIIYYALNPWKMLRRIQYSLNYSGTTFLS